MTDADTLFAWAHLTDPLFGADDEPAHGLVLEALARDLLDGPQARHPRPRPRVIVITGDLAATPSAEAYGRAYTALVELAGAAKIEVNRVFAVPGDRDMPPPTGPLKYVLPALRGGGSIDEALADKDTRALLAGRRAGFSRCALRLAPDTRQLWWSNRMPAGGLAVRLVGLDTALLATGDDGKRLQLGAEAVGRTIKVAEPDEIVITLAHHPLTAEWLGDAERAAALGARAHLHLHGNASPGSALRGSGTGASVISVAPRPLSGTTPGYVLGAVQRAADGLVVCLWPRRLNRDGGFTSDSEVLPDGRFFIEHPLPGPTPRIAAATESSAAPAADPVLDAWRGHLRAVHEQLAPLFRGCGHDLLEEVFVQLDVTADAPGDAEAAREPERRALTLDALMQAGHHWAVLGEPGAGKSTLARRLTWQLAGRTDPEAPVPLFVGLARLAREKLDPFALAAAELRPVNSAAADAIAARLRRHADQGRLWIFFDGLDEVPGDDQPTVRQAIASLAVALPRARMAIFARPVGYHSPAPCFRIARVNPLTTGQQRALLERWLVDPARVERTLRDLERRPRLADGARNPLLLTLIARVARDGGGVPRDRTRLFGEAIDVLLKRGCTDQADGVPEPDAARDVLAPLSLDLQASGGEDWPRPELARRLRGLTDDRAVARAVAVCGGERRCLDSIAEASGIIAPHDGPSLPWTYLHRSLRERLAAEALARRGDAAIEAQAQAVGDDPEALGRWGVTLAMACAQSADPLPLLAKLRVLSAPLALRVLPDVEGLDPDAAFDFLVQTPGWDGDDLLALGADWPDTAATTARIMRLVTPGADLDRVAFAHYALAGLGALPERAAFFGAAGRALPGPELAVPMVDVAPGEFMMGSPDDEEGRWADEGPQHRVTLTRGFRLGATPVTVAQYAAFDPKHGGEDPTHPVVDVSWWRAYLFAAWAGGRLPTEAEWEYACRAGTTTRYWSGDGEADLNRVGWYGGNSYRSTHPVAGKLANSWGLFDIHGNVWEWCADWGGDYPSGPQTDPLGPPRGVIRVYRGGSYLSGARRARSAYRVWWHPAGRDRDHGFRLAAPPQLDLDLDG